MQKITAHVSGMHCASCVARIEKTIGKQKGVQVVSVNFATEEARITFDTSQTNIGTLSKAVEPMGYKLHAKEQAMVEGHEEGHDHVSAFEGEASILKKKIFISIPLVVFAAVVMGWDILAKYAIVPEMSETLYEFFHHLLPIFATYMLFTVGTPYLRGLWMFFRRGVADMDTLVGLGTMTAFLYSFALAAFEVPLAPYLDVSATYYDVTIVVIGLITLGKYFEAQAKQKTGSAIKKLIGLQVKTAIVLRNGKEETLPIDQVQKGDLVLIKPGMKIPVDGMIAEGSSFLDEAMLTGEPVPIEKKEGDKVSAGTMNTTGAFTMQATGIGSETLLAHIITLVADAQGSKAPIQRLADKISSVFVPAVLVIAVLALMAWLIIGGQYIPFSQAVSFGLASFVAVLVIACPCALGLATPTAIIVGVGKGAKEGILIKDAATLEKLHKVDTVVVDKTGTITRGKPELVGVQIFSDLSQKEVISIIASLESKSEHPIAHAITEHAKKKKIDLVSVNGFESIKGKGLKGQINTIEYFAGNTKLIADLKLPFDAESPGMKQVTFEGKTPVILATKEEVIAVILVADAIKPEAVQAVKDIHALGIKVVMLTGDMKNTAEAIAKEVGIDEVVAEVMPEDKLDMIKELQRQGHLVAMAGDGVNDAPALAQADVGIAMGTGTDVAIETAGITLLNGDISKLVKAIHLSKITMTGIKQNLFWAFIYNIVGIPLAAGLFFPFFGWLLNPVFAGLAMAFSSVSVVGNSLRLKAKKL
ncbi:copper-translocating P-type ATPase [Patescibacteria group bacterium]|nr:copper-translocating P-type ATPase [Patescibacteria group bacterium]MBP9710473.1 copper-translocating P-type ATPase [Patescibacteria group bacterium]